MAALGEITNYVALAPDIATSGQPHREQFADIAAAGYEAVVNLALPSSDHALADEGSIVTRLDMSYFHLPVVFQAPTDEDLRLFFGIMRALDGRRVWVHCVVNARVSAFVYLYLRRVRGWDEGAATSPVLTAWRPTMDAVWQRFLERGMSIAA